MTAIDTGEALALLLASGVRKSLPNAPKSGETKDAGIRQLSREIGKSDHFISDHLNLVKESPEVQKYLRTTDAKYSLIRDINKKAPIVNGVYSPLGVKVENSLQSEHSPMVSEI